VISSPLVVTREKITPVVLPPFQFRVKLPHIPAVHVDNIVPPSLPGVKAGRLLQQVTLGSGEEGVGFVGGIKNRFAGFRVKGKR
jgi:hypothetical protein